jgi:molybdopterin molybdotransferase
MIGIDEAFALLLPRFLPLSSERVSLDQALGRFLASSLAVREDVPPFDNSAMDGYAVRAEDLVGATAEQPVALPLVVESRAGGAAPGTLAPRSVARIFTGAPLPDGADTVVMQEEVERVRADVLFRAAPSRGRHVRRQASVLAVGGSLLDAGAALGSGEIGVLASQGFAQVPVHRRPRVALLSTGDELRDVGEPARPGTLVDSNSHALAAAVREAGGEPLVLPRAPDEPEALVRAVRDGIASADVLVTCGGVSVGEYDLLHEAFRQAGVEEVFWKVRIKPGKPIRFGVAGRVPVVGLPGNPVSALLTFELFVRPGLRRMLGDPRPHREPVEVELGTPMVAPSGRTELCRARLELRERARPIAWPHADQGSGALTSLVGLDALIVLPEGKGAMPEGTVVRALDLRARGSARVPFDVVSR